MFQENIFDVNVTIIGFDVDDGPRESMVSRSDNFSIITVAIFLTIILLVTLITCTGRPKRSDGRQKRDKKKKDNIKKKRTKRSRRTRKTTTTNVARTTVTTTTPETTPVTDTAVGTTPVMTSVKAETTSAAMADKTIILTSEMITDALQQDNNISKGKSQAKLGKSGFSKPKKLSIPYFGGETGSIHSDKSLMDDEALTWDGSNKINQTSQQTKQLSGESNTKMDVDLYSQKVSMDVSTVNKKMMESLKKSSPLDGLDDYLSSSEKSKLETPITKSSSVRTVSEMFAGLWLKKFNDDDSSFKADLSKTKLKGITRQSSLKKQKPTRWQTSRRISSRSAAISAKYARQNESKKDISSLMKNATKMLNKFQKFFTKKSTQLPSDDGLDDDIEKQPKKFTTTTLKSSQPKRMPRVLNEFEPESNVVRIPTEKDIEPDGSSMVSILKRQQQPTTILNERQEKPLLSNEEQELQRKVRFKENWHILKKKLDKGQPSKEYREDNQIADLDVQKPKHSTAIGESIIPTKMDKEMSQIKIDSKKPIISQKYSTQPSQQQQPTTFISSTSNENQTSKITRIIKEPEFVVEIPTPASQVTIKQSSSPNYKSTSQVHLASTRRQIKSDPTGMISKKQPRTRKGGFSVVARRISPTIMAKMGTMMRPSGLEPGTKESWLPKAKFPNRIWQKRAWWQFFR